MKGLYKTKYIDGFGLSFSYFFHYMSVSFISYFRCFCKLTILAESCCVWSSSYYFLLNIFIFLICMCQPRFLQSSTIASYSDRIANKSAVLCVSRQNNGRVGFIHVGGAGACVLHRGHTLRLFLDSPAPSGIAKCEHRQLCDTVYGPFRR